jgi:O-antigen/teichoic acid export membrane protein
MTGGPRAGVRQIGSVAVANALTAAAQVAVLTALARAGSTSEVADFALATAVSAPLYAVLTIGLRLAHLRQSGAEAEPFATFLWARLCSVVVAGAVAVALHLLISGSLTALVVAVVTWRGVDGLADVVTAEHLRHGRAARSATVQSVRAIVAIGGAGVILVGGPSWIWILAAGSLLQFVLSDLPGVRGAGAGRHASTTAVLGTIRWSLPLGIASGAVALTFGAPRIVLGWWGTEAELSRFSVASTIFTLVSLLTAAVGDVSIPVLAARAGAGDVAGLRRGLRRMLLTGLAAAATVGGAAITIGPWVVRTVLGAEYEPSRSVLAVLSLALTFACLRTFLQDGLTALGSRARQVVGFGAGLVVTAATALALAGPLGDLGAAWSLAAGVGVQMLVLAIALQLRLVEAERGTPPASPPARRTGPVPT